MKNIYYIYFLLFFFFSCNTPQESIDSIFNKAEFHIKIYSCDKLGCRMSNLNISKSQNEFILKGTTISGEKNISESQLAEIKELFKKYIKSESPTISSLNYTKYKISGSYFSVSFTDNSNNVEPKLYSIID